MRTRSKPHADPLAAYVADLERGARAPTQAELARMSPMGLAGAMHVYADTIRYNAAVVRVKSNTLRRDPTNSAARASIDAALGDRSSAQSALAEACHHALSGVEAFAERVAARFVATLRNERR